MVTNRSGKRRHLVTALRKLAVTEANIVGLVVNREGALTGDFYTDLSCSTTLFPAFSRLDSRRSPGCQRGPGGDAPRARAEGVTLALVPVARGDRQL